jgi:hypothetical protein
MSAYIHVSHGLYDKEYAIDTLYHKELIQQ